jgi:hypothetical protein
MVNMTNYEDHAVYLYDDDFVDDCHRRVREFYNK